MDTTLSDMICWPIEIDGDYIWPATESTEIDLECYTEEFSIKGAITKIWDMIKTIFRKIVDKLKQLVSFIGGIFQKEEEPQSADQILEELNVRAHEIAQGQINFQGSGMTTAISNPVGANEVRYGQKEIRLAFLPNKGIRIDANELFKVLYAKTQVAKQDIVQPHYAAVALILDRGLCNDFFGFIKTLSEKKKIGNLGIRSLDKQFTDFSKDISKKITKLGLQGKFIVKFDRIIEFSQKF